MTTYNIEKARKAYAKFEEKVKRSVFLDNLSPQVTSVVIKSALGQFGVVVDVEFIPNHSIPYPIPHCALVEMENPYQARAAISTMTTFPFMMIGMPRPVRAFPAKAEMFADRPHPPDRKLEVEWVHASDPNFRVAKRMKELCKKHTAENLAMLKNELLEEEKLAKQQEVMLKSNNKKLELIGRAIRDGSASRLACRYGMNLGAYE